MEKPVLVCSLPFHVNMCFCSLYITEQKRSGNKDQMEMYDPDEGHQLPRYCVTARRGVHRRSRGTHTWTTGRTGT